MDNLFEKIDENTYKVGNIVYQYFTVAGNANVYDIPVYSGFKQILGVTMNGLSNEGQINEAFSQQYLHSAYSEMISNKNMRVRKLNTQTIQGCIIGLIEL